MGTPQRYLSGLSDTVQCRVAAACAVDRLRVPNRAVGLQPSKFCCLGVGHPQSGKADASDLMGGAAGSLKHFANPNATLWGPGKKKKNFALLFFLD